MGGRTNTSFAHFSQKSEWLRNSTAEYCRRKKQQFNFVSDKWFHCALNDCQPEPRMCSQINLCQLLLRRPCCKTNPEHVPRTLDKSNHAVVSIVSWTLFGATYNNVQHVPPLLHSSLEHAQNMREAANSRACEEWLRSLNASALCYIRYSTTTQSFLLYACAASCIRNTDPACLKVASCFPKPTTAPSTSVTCSAPFRRFCSSDPTFARVSMQPCAHTGHTPQPKTSNGPGPSPSESTQHRPSVETLPWTLSPATGLLCMQSSVRSMEDLHVVIHGGCLALQARKRPFQSLAVRSGNALISSHFIW